MNRLYFQGTEITDYTEGLEEISINTSKNKESFISISQSSTFILKGLAYELFNDIFFINACENVQKVFDGKIFIECCNKWIDIEIKAHGISFCHEKCYAKVNVNQKIPVNECIELMKSTPFFEGGFLNYGVANKAIKPHSYVKEFSFLDIILFTMYSSFTPIIELIIAIADFVGFSHKGLDRLTNDFINAGEFSPLFSFKEIFIYWFEKKCGLQFVSSILREHIEYQHLHFWSQQRSQGTNVDQCHTNPYNEHNLLNQNPIELLNSLIGVFNARGEFLDNKFYFEHVSFFKNIEYELFSIDEEFSKGNILECPEVRFDQTELCARVYLEFKRDNIDTEGNRTLDKYITVRDLNPNLSEENRKEDCKPLIPYAGTRFTEDRERRDSTTYLWYQGGKSGFGLGNYRMTHSLVISGKTAEWPKLIIVDPNFKYNFNNCDFVYPIKRQIKTGPGYVGPFLRNEGEYEYNYPLYTDTLFDRFYANTKEEEKPINYPVITWKPDDFCLVEEILNRYKFLSVIKKENKSRGQFESYRINYKSKTITFNNVKFGC